MQRRVDLLALAHVNGQTHRFGPLPTLRADKDDERSIVNLIANPADNIPALLVARPLVFWNHRGTTTVQTQWFRAPTTLDWPAHGRQRASP